jgi:hypothetical protein
MASKKMKKALALGLGVGLGAKFLAGKARAASIATNEAKEAGFASTGKKYNYITKKVKDKVQNKGVMSNLKDATKKVFKENINLGRGPKIKPSDSLAGDYRGAFDYLDFNAGGQATKMVKARGGKLVNLKPTKMS